MIETKEEYDTSIVGIWGAGLGQRGGTVEYRSMAR